MKRFFIVIILFNCLASNILAQNIINYSETKQRVLLRTGIDPSWNLVLSYQRNVKLNNMNKAITAYGEWKASVVRPGLNNWDANFGGIIPLFKKNNFVIINDLYGSLGKLKTRNFNSFDFLLGDRINIGFFKEKSYFAFTTEYNKFLLTHLTHTDYYRNTFYEDAKDGWYKSTGGYFQFGFTGGFTFNKKFDLYAEIKLPLTEKFDSYNGSPFHINLGFGYRF
jgi:hypothetical protein